MTDQPTATQPTPPIRDERPGPYLSRDEALRRIVARFGPLRPAQRSRLAVLLATPEPERRPVRRRRGHPTP